MDAAFAADDKLAQGRRCVAGPGSDQTERQGQKNKCPQHSFVAAYSERVERYCNIGIADPEPEFSRRVEEAWPLTLDPSPRAIHVSGVTARGEGRVREHPNSTVRRQDWNCAAGARKFKCRFCGQSKAHRVLEGTPPRLG